MIRHRKDASHRRNACGCFHMQETAKRLRRYCVLLSIRRLLPSGTISGTGFTVPGGNPEKMIERPVMETRRMAIPSRQNSIRFTLALLGAAAALGLTGCGNFFQCEG